MTSDKRKETHAEVERLNLALKRETERKKIQSIDDDPLLHDRAAGYLWVLVKDHAFWCNTIDCVLCGMIQRAVTFVEEQDA